MNRNSAQNSQYSSTGVGFQIRNDLCATTTARYPLIPSQAPAPRRAHTSAGARTSAILLQICRRSRWHVIVNANSMRRDIVPTSFSMPMQPLCYFNFTHSQVHINFKPSTAKLRRNHYNDATQCLPINFTNTLRVLAIHQTTTSQLRRNHYNDATQCLPNNFATTPVMLAIRSSTPCIDLPYYIDATQCNPISRPRISPKSLADHLQFTWESLEHARPYATIMAA